MRVGPHPARMPTPSFPSFGLTVARLQHDWHRLVRSTRHCDLDRLLAEAGWRPHRETKDDTPATEAIDPVRADRTLAGLVAAARHDPLAARVVLQRLLPGLIALARRRAAWAGLPGGPVLDELVAETWIVIREFPVERRPVHVAGNLLREVEYRAFTRPARLRRHAALTGDGVAPRCSAAPYGEMIDAATEEAQEQRHRRFAAEHPFAELVEVLRAAVESGASDDDVQFLGALASGMTTDEVAARRRVSGRAERYRRARLIAWLQTEVLDLPTVRFEAGGKIEAGGNIERGGADGVGGAPPARVCGP